MNFLITAKCGNGHSEEIRVEESLGPEWVKNLAGLLDGTSPFYVHSPIGTDSVIGKCGICLAQLECTITNSEPAGVKCERKGGEES